MPIPLVGLEILEIQQLLGPDLPPFRARQVYEAVYRQRVAGLHHITTLPLALRRRLEETLCSGLPEVAASFESSDGTCRYLLRLDDSRTVESVLMPEPRVSQGFGAEEPGEPRSVEKRDTICISTQVGCPVDCKFCLTALMGLERNLTAGEIVGQVLHLAGDNGLWADRKRMNIVFMGQGEPLLNLPTLLKAIRILANPRGFEISVRRMTVSTSGLIPKIEELAKTPDAERPRLAISLNASNEEQRRELMPITRKYHLRELLETCRAYPLRPWERLSFEYVLLKDVNDSEADARRVVRLLANINCKVNLIALNPGPGIPFETPSPESVARFQAILRRSFPAFIRKPRGLDIYAACGQLKRMETLTQIG